MNFNMKYDVVAEAKALLEMKSPLKTFKPEDIGTFVLAWSGNDATTSVRGTLMAFGCDERGEYAIVKVWVSGAITRYELVAPLPSSMLPTTTTTTETKTWRDPDVKVTRMFTYESLH